MEEPSTQRRAIVAVLAICSGVASYYAAANDFLALPGSFSLAPGVMFGAVLAFAIGWTRPDAMQSAVIVALTTLAWYLAAHCWILTGDLIGPYFDAQRSLQSRLADTGPALQFGFMGIVTGLVGAALTWAGVAVARKQARTSALLAQLAAYGAISGAASETIRFAASDGAMRHTAIIVFPLWQAGIALIIISWVTRRLGDPR
jgi:hypothetical protein